MLSKLNQKKIKLKLYNIYKSELSKSKIDIYFNEILQLLNQFNKTNPKKKKVISEKTNLLISKAFVLSD